jgi:hypothetical protein
MLESSLSILPNLFTKVYLVEKDIDLRLSLLSPALFTM